MLTPTWLASKWGTWNQLEWKGVGLGGLGRVWGWSIKTAEPKIKKTHFRGQFWVRVKFEDKNCFKTIMGLGGLGRVWGWAIWNMGLSKTSDHIQIKIKIQDPSQELPLSSKAPIHYLKDMDVLCISKIKSASQNLDHGCIKDKCPYPNQD